LFGPFIPVDGEDERADEGLERDGKEGEEVEVEGDGEEVDGDGEEHGEGE